MPDSETSLIFRGVSQRFGRRDLKRFAAVLEHTAARGRGFVCLIANDAELRRLNLQFRGRDYPTDVLSFPSVGGASLGDIAISAQRAAEQARERGHAIEDELRILMLHGVLHLMGLDHETDDGRMRRAERRWRKQLGLPEALTDREAPAPNRERKRAAGAQAR